MRCTVLCVVLVPWLATTGPGQIHFKMKYVHTGDTYWEDKTGDHLKAHFAAAAKIWQSVLRGKKTYSFSFYWDDMTGTGLAGEYIKDLNRKLKWRRRIRIASNIRNWFVDRTPDDHSEFDFAAELARDYTTQWPTWFKGTPPNVLEVAYAGTARSGTKAANRLDLLSVVLHEIGHAIGVLNNGWKLFPPGANRAPLDVRAVRKHVAVNRSLMFTGTGASRRYLPSTLIALIVMRDQKLPAVDVPRKYWFKGNRRFWSEDDNWMAFMRPHEGDDVFLLDNATCELRAEPGGRLELGGRHGRIDNLTVSDASRFDFLHYDRSQQPLHVREEWRISAGRPGEGTTRVRIDGRENPHGIHALVGRLSVSGGSRLRLQGAKMRVGRLHFARALVSGNGVLAGLHDLRIDGSGTRIKAENGQLYFDSAAALTTGDGSGLEELDALRHDVLFHRVQLDAVPGHLKIGTRRSVIFNRGGLELARQGFAELGDRARLIVHHDLRTGSDGFSRLFLQGPHAHASVGRTLSVDNASTVHLYKGSSIAADRLLVEGASTVFVLAGKNHVNAGRLDLAHGSMTVKKDSTITTAGVVGKADRIGLRGSDRKRRKGELVLDGSAVVWNAGAVEVGGYGGDGKLTMSGGAVANVHDLVIGANAPHWLHVAPDRGVPRVWTEVAPFASGTCTVTGSKTRIDVAGRARVGASGVGHLHLDGGHLTCVQATLGDVQTTWTQNPPPYPFLARGTLRVTAGGSLSTTGLVVGNQGSGTLTVLDGRVDCQTLAVAARGGWGNVGVHAKGHLAATTSVSISGSSTSAGQGTGTLSVWQGRVDGGREIRVWPRGRLDLHRGTVRAGHVASSGVTVGNGTLKVGRYVNSGTLRPVDVITVRGDFEQTPAGTYEVHTTAKRSTVGKVHVVGDAALSGTISVRSYEKYAAETRFEILTGTGTIQVTNAKVTDTDGKNQWTLVQGRGSVSIESR